MTVVQQQQRRGYYGIGVYHPKSEENIGTLWRAAYLYGASFLFTIGRRYQKQASDTPKTHRHVPLWHFLDYEAFHTHLPSGAQVVCVELAGGARALPVAHHPECAVYLLGAEDHGLPPALLEGKQVVQIPTLRPQSMNVAMAGSLVLYDRYVKREWGREDL